jgi:hypothetical protein
MRRTAAALIVAGGLALTGCSGSSSGSSSGPKAEESGVPTPVATIPVDVAELSQTVGEYVVDPSKDLNSAQVDASVAKLKGMPGVQSATLTSGQIHVVILPAATTTQREDVERQLAALGTVSEGV